MTVLNSEISRGKTILEETVKEENLINNEEQDTSPQISRNGSPVLKSILVKDRKTAQRKRNELLSTVDQELRDTNSMTTQSGIENCSLTFRPAYIIPVPTYKKIKFNNKMLHNMKR